MNKKTLLAVLTAFMTVLPLVAQQSVLYVDSSLDDDEACADDTYFNSLRDALVEAENMQRQYEYSADNPLTIKIAPGVYWLDDPDDPEVRRPEAGEGTPYAMKLKMNHLRLTGLSDNPEDVVLACNRGQTQGAVGNFTMLHITGDDIQVENLTFGNYCNVDLEYPRNPSLNRKKRADAIVQAQLVICDGDRYVARNCRFISRLNLCPFAGAKRILFDRCYFECTDDALCGTGVYLGCRFTFFSGKPFYNTYAQGACFLDCDIHSKTIGRQYLVKAGSQVTMVDCRWTSDDPDLYLGWTQDPTPDLRCYQHNVTLNGKPVVIDMEHPRQTVVMTHLPLLKAYKCGDTYNVYNLVRGKDGWNPLKQDTTRLVMQPTMFTLDKRKASIETAKDTLVIKSGYYYTNWDLVKGGWKYVELRIYEPGELTVIGRNNEETPQVVNVVAWTDEGVAAECEVTVYPPELPAPDFKSLPVIVRKGNTLHVDYALDLGKRKDMSAVTWYRAKSEDGSDAIPVAVSRNDIPKLDYELSAADNGYYIIAAVAPRHIRSNYGEPERTVTPSPVTDVPQCKSITTAFVNFPTEYQPAVIPGFWTVDAFKPADTAEYDWIPDKEHSWYYGNGVDGAAKSVGLMQNTRGARLLYNPEGEKYGDMSLTLHVDPCKTAGQGFGSATGQYMDVYVKFDAATLSGYALRVIRTVKNDKAVDFMLMKYDNGIAVPISEPVSAVCYRKGCRITLDVKGDRLTANVTNEAGVPEPHRPGLVKTVNLAADIEPNEYGGIGVQHTGSWGPSATLLRFLSVTWE